MDGLERIVEGLAGARRVLFVTGAGISAESGLPTYRGIGGLYERETTEEGVPIEVALSGPMFARRPELTWKYLRQIEEACRGARANRAHDIVAAFERVFEKVVVLTQNVDGFHRAAGSTDVIDIHGDVHDLRCTACAWRGRVDDYAALAPLPRCEACGAVVRPEVVLFEELLPPAKVLRMARALALGFDAVFSIGTSSVFPYIARPVLDAAYAGALTVEVNPSRTVVSDVVSVRLETGAVRALEAIWARVGRAA